MRAYSQVPNYIRHDAASFVVAAVRSRHMTSSSLWPAAPPPPPVPPLPSVPVAADPPPWTLYRAELYRQRLPSSCVAWASAEGRARFREALAAGTAACFLGLSAHFDAQAEPATCGLGSAAVALNALGLRAADGMPWADASLAALPPLAARRPWSDVLARGTDVDEVSELLRAAGAPHVELVHARADAPAFAHGGEPPGAGLAAFRAAAMRAAAAPASQAVLLMSFSRAALLQTGDGHFSPLGGYHASSDSLLVLDAAKFKYPPYWCSLPAMWRAMQATDWETGRPRGYLIVSASAAAGDSG